MKPELVPGAESGEARHFYINHKIKEDILK